MKLELDDQRLVICLAVPNTDVEIEASCSGMVLTFQREVTGKLRSFLGQDDTVHVERGAEGIRAYLRRTYGIDINAADVEDVLRCAR